jgi:hypothetical protein
LLFLIDFEFSILLMILLVRICKFIIHQSTIIQFRKMDNTNPGKEEEVVEHSGKRQREDDETVDEPKAAPAELQFIPFVDKASGKEYLNAAAYEKYWGFKEPFIPDGNRAIYVANTFKYADFCRDNGLPPIDRSIKERAAGSIVLSTPTFQKLPFGFSPYLDDEGKWQNALRMSLSPSPLDPETSKHWIEHSLPEIDSFLKRKAWENQAVWKFQYGSLPKAEATLAQSMTPTIRAGNEDKDQPDYLSLKYLHPKLSDGSFDKKRAIVDVWSWDPEDFAPKLLAEELNLEENVAVYIDDLGVEHKNEDLTKVHVPRGCYARAIYCVKNQWISKGKKAEWGSSNVLIALIVANETLMSKLAAKTEGHRSKKACPITITD